MHMLAHRTCLILGNLTMMSRCASLLHPPASCVTVMYIHTSQVVCEACISYWYICRLVKPQVRAEVPFCCSWRSGLLLEGIIQQPLTGQNPNGSCTQHCSSKHMTGICWCKGCCWQAKIASSTCGMPRFHTVWSLLLAQHMMICNLTVVAFSELLRTQSVLSMLALCHIIQ